MSGSTALWEVAELAGVVPQPPDPVLRGMFAAWLASPPERGCVSAGGLLWVAAPDPRVWCGECIADRFAATRACVYCRKRLRLGKGRVLIYEVGENVRVLARCHPGCAEKARKP